jgi:glycosyltransferase involved in cell wall biosynthesis
MATSEGIIYLPPGGDTCPRFIIEARMLGCDLIINENVQHKNEPWFENRETTIKYLRQRTKIFWSEIENKWNIETPKRKDTTNHKFNIIVPFYNAGPWIKKCIESIKGQTHQNFNCFLIDDVSTDDTSKIIEKEIKNDERFLLTTNANKEYALGNIVKTLINNKCDEEDINIILDGDDWLSSYNVLSHLDDIYSTSKCLMTYGSYVYYPNGVKGIEPSDYPADVINGNKFRQDRWRASHLRTFKTKLWKNIDLEDLKDDDGQYYKTAYDQALMLPLLEMAGEKSKYISEILHVYNRENPLNVDKVKQKIQFETAQKIRAKKPYKRKF